MTAAFVRVPDKYEVIGCEAEAALDQECDTQAVAEVDGAPLCHYHARQAYDHEYSDVSRLSLKAR
jgi:hypothetical protein